MEMKNKILIVDDNPINRIVLTEIFKDEFEILEAENGAIAIDIIRRKKNDINLIVLDIVMHGKNGFQVLEELKLDLELINIPVVAVSTIDDTSNETRALDMGAIDIITQPFDPKIVKQRIKNLLQLSQTGKIKAENEALKKQAEILKNLREQEKKTLEATLELKYRAQHASLTGIYNRQKFNEVTEELIKDNPFLTEISEEKLMLNSLIHNLPTGLIIYKVNEKVKPLFISDHSYSIFGIDSVEYSNMVEEGFQTDFIYNKILEKVTNYKIVETEESFETVFSMIKADGELIWIRAIGKFKNQRNGEKLCYMLLVDTTNTMERLNIKERENDLFRTLIEDTQTLIFDYDVSKDLIYFTIKVSKETNIDKKIENYMQNFYSNSFIHKDFMEEYKIKFLYAIHDSVSESNVYLADYLGTGYRWYKENYKSLYDESGKIYRIVGSAYDITAEKEVKAELIIKAEIDGISGLYNRITVEKRIDDTLKSDGYKIFRGDKSKKAFIVFDIDNLKEVNDIEGHFVGDTIIKEFSGILKDTFSEDAIVGRSGGDEFIVLVNLTEDNDCIDKYMEEVHLKLENISCKMNFENPVTASAGIVFAPMYGKKFNVLYSKADKALFQAKNNGKGKYSIYNK